MDARPATSPGVTLYASDRIELETLAPVGRELEALGLDVTSTDDFSAPAEIGVYACHSNRFFDFQAGRWTRPASAFSAIFLHDLGQSNGSEDYWRNDSWHVFDLGLLPGASWQRLADRAAQDGVPGPRHGMVTVGWPKFDHVYARPEAFSKARECLRSELGLTGDRPAVLLACSWSDRRQLADTVAALRPLPVDLVVKYPDFPPPEPTSPWFERLTEARAELLRAKDLAGATPGVVVADTDVDLYALLDLVDVVVSNGSNVMYEGVLMGTPGISVREWEHPVGRYGERTLRPHMDLDGVLTGSTGSLRQLIQTALVPSFRTVIAHGSAALVAPATHGRAARCAAQALLSLYQQAGPWPAPESAWAATGAVARVADDSERAEEQAAAEGAVGELPTSVRHLKAELAGVLEHQRTLQDAVRRTEEEAEALRGDVLRLNHLAQHRGELLSRERLTVVKPVLRRAYAAAVRAGRSLPPATRDRVRAGLSPVVARVAPGSTSAQLVRQAARED